MPPNRQFSRDQVVAAAFEVAEKEGISGLTARKVADALGSSVAPIYANFGDIQDLKKAVVRRMLEISRQMTQKDYAENPFLNAGIASLRFAREYSVLFRDLVLNPNEYMNEPQGELDEDIVGEMGSDPDLEGLGEEELRVILLKMKIFQLGLSLMVANGMLPKEFDEDAQVDLLTTAGSDIIAGTRLRALGELK